MPFFLCYRNNLAGYHTLFNEYDSISKDQFDSKEFWEKYLIEKGRPLPSNTAIMKVLAKKMNKDMVPMPPTDEVKSFKAEFELQDKSVFEIETCSRMHRNKKIESLKLKAGWSSKLARLIYEKTNFSCKFDFKHNWISKERLVKTEGICDCQAIAKISYRHGVINLQIDNVSTTYKHSRVYKIGNETKEELIEELKHKKALAVRSKFVNKINPDNTNLKTEFHPFVPSLNAINLLRFKDRKIDAHPIDILLEWKDGEYQNVISAISHSPFYMFWQTPLQLAWYVAESKQKKMTITFDATGSLVTPPLRSQKIPGTDKLKHCFVYPIMAKTATKSIPIAQMISQDQTSEFISFFIQKVFKKLKLPEAIITDGGKALLKSVCKTFAHCDNLEDYIACSMSSLLFGTPPPKRYVRIDRSHFVKNVSNKIKHRDYRKRNLFRCVVGCLIQCDSFEYAINIITDLFTVILNEHDGVDDSNQQLPAEISKRRLLALCKTHDENEYEASTESESPNNDLDFNADSGWLSELVSKVPITSSGSHENLYYSPDDVQMFSKLFSSIVLWSNIMNHKYGSSSKVATSSDVECFFKLLKRNIFEPKLYRADEFFVIYTEFVNSEVKLNALSNNSVNTPAAKRKRSDSLHEKAAESPGNFYTHSGCDIN